MIPKVIAIQEVNDLNKKPLEEIMSSLTSHEIELNDDHPKKN